MDQNRNSNNSQQSNNDSDNSWEKARENWENLEAEEERKKWDHWDSNAEHSSYYNQPTHTPYDQGFAIASVIMGVLSITLGCCFFSLPFGALGILFAMLCHRKGKRFNSNCKIGLTLSILGIAAWLLMVAYTVFMWYSNPTQFMEQLNQTSQMLYGMDFNEMLQYQGIRP